MATKSADSGQRTAVSHDLDEQSAGKRQGTFVQILRAALRTLWLAGVLVGLLSAPVGAQEEPAVPAGSSQAGAQPSGSGSSAGGKLSPLLSSRGTILSDSESNAILVVDYPENIQRVAEYLAVVDAPAPQVAIEARVVEVKLQGEHALGINWTVLAKHQGVHLGGMRLFSSVSGDLGSITPNIPFKPTFFPPGTTTTQESPFSVTIFRDDLSVVLSMLANALKTDILSAPRVATLNNQWGEIRIVQRLPWAEPTVTTTGSGSTASVQVTYEINFEEVGIRLRVRPIINEKDRVITMDLDPEVSERVSDFSLTLVTGGTPSSLTYTVPVVDRRSASTRVLIGDKQTLIIGGLIKDKSTKGVTKIPAMGDLPYVGGLFRSKKDTTDKTELLFFVSPTIITPAEFARHEREERFGEAGSGFAAERKRREQMIDARASEAQAAGERATLESQIQSLRERQASLSKERQALEQSVQAEERQLTTLQTRKNTLFQQMKQVGEPAAPATPLLTR